MTNKGLISNIYKQLIQLNIKKTQPTLKNGQKNQANIFQRGNADGQQALKRCSTLLIIGEMPIKTTM